MDQQDLAIIAAFTAAAAAIVAALATPGFSFLLDGIRLINTKKEIAKLIIAEYETLSEHNKANLAKLKKLLGNVSEGARIDFEKLRFFGPEVIVVDFQKIYLLSENLSQAILRMALFKRNNELEISSAIDVWFDSRASVSDGQKKEIIQRLIDRVDVTEAMSAVIVGRLRVYERDPDTYDDVKVNWDPELWRKTGAFVAQKHGSE